MKEFKNVVSIFSGVDLLGLGFCNYFNLTLHVEIKKECCTSLKENKKYFPNSEVWNRDIYSVTDEEILAVKEKGVHGLIGGSNCQPFSPAKGVFDPNDTRIQGLFEYLRWVRLLEPEWFVMENTFGLLEGSKKQIFDYFQKMAEHLGYTVNAQVLNAHDYGSAQMRKRLIAVGVKNTASWHFEFPQPVSEDKRKFVKDILVNGEELGECLQYSQDRKAIVSHVPEGGNWRNLEEVWQRRALGANYDKREGGMTGVYRRLHRDKACPTLVTNPCQRNTMCAHPLEDRPLSVNEYRRAQGVPEDYVLVGSTNWKYEALGNGVPVELAQTVCKAIVACQIKRHLILKAQ